MNALQVLMVEDNPADADLTRDCLENLRLIVNLHVVSDGNAALAFVAQQGQYLYAPQPDVIVLDLNLPGKGGREVLSELKDHPVWKRIPVVILTSSEAEKDIVLSYDLGANCYVTKPLDLRSFQHIIQTISQFWFTTVKLPTRA